MEREPERTDSAEITYRTEKPKTMAFRPIQAFLLLLALLPGPALRARDQKVRDVDINITLIKNGNIVVHERWDVDTGDQITEWYLVRENLEDIEITGFSVFDGDDNKLQDDGEWNVNRSREEKAGRYGIVHKSDGVELCWGVGMPTSTLLWDKTDRGAWLQSHRAPVWSLRAGYSTGGQIQQFLQPLLA